jgi:hypothetical protein
VRDTSNSIPKFTGKTTVKFGNSLYVWPTAGLFSLFWLSKRVILGECWGELANSALHHFKTLEDLTIINYNNGRINDKVATAEAEKVRKNTVGTNNRSYCSF